MRTSWKNGAVRSAVLISGLVAAAPWVVAAQAAPSARPAAFSTVSIACGDVAGLNAAITAANTSGIPTRILLAPGCAYTLTTPAPGGGLRGPNGLAAVTGDVTLVGHVTTIQRAMSAKTQFRIAAVSGPSGELTIRGVTLSGGIAHGGGPSPAGGCVIVGGGEPVAPTRDGGFSGARLNLIDSKVENCTAANGGGIYVSTFGSALISGSVLISNSVTGDGGAVYDAAGGQASILSSYVGGNQAAYHGGGVYLGSEILNPPPNGPLRPAVTVAGSVLSENSGYEAGGIYNGGQVLAIQGSRLMFNSATTFGGGLSDYGQDTSILLSQFTRNTAGITGGAVYNGSGATMSVIASVFFYNHPNNCSPAGTVWSCYN